MTKRKPVPSPDQQTFFAAPVIDQTPGQAIRTNARRAAWRRRQRRCRANRQAYIRWPEQIHIPHAPRTPRRDLEERIVLPIFINREFLRRARALVPPRLIENEQLRLVYVAALEVHEAGGQITRQSVVNHLAKQGVFMWDRGAWIDAAVRCIPGTWGPERTDEAAGELLKQA